MRFARLEAFYFNDWVRFLYTCNPSNLASLLVRREGQKASSPAL